MDKLYIMWMSNPSYNKTELGKEIKVINYDVSYIIYKNGFISALEKWKM